MYLCKEVLLAVNIYLSSPHRTLWRVLATFAPRRCFWLVAAGRHPGTGRVYQMKITSSSLNKDEDGL